MTCISLTFATFLEDSPDIIVYCVSAGVIPLLLQLHLVYGGYNWCCETLVKAKFTLFFTLIGAILGLAYIIMIVYNVVYQILFAPAINDDILVNKMMKITSTIMGAATAAWILLG